MCSVGVYLTRDQQSSDRVMVLILRWTLELAVIAVAVSLESLLDVIED